MNDEQFDGQIFCVVHHTDQGQVVLERDSTDDGVEGMRVRALDKDGIVSFTVGVPGDPDNAQAMCIMALHGFGREEAEAIGHWIRSGGSGSRQHSAAYFLLWLSRMAIAASDAEGIERSRVEEALNDATETMRKFAPGGAGH